MLHHDYLCNRSSLINLLANQILMLSRAIMARSGPRSTCNFVTLWPKSILVFISGTKRKNPFKSFLKISVLWSPWSPFFCKVLPFCPSFTVSSVSQRLGVHQLQFNVQTHFVTASTWSWLRTEILQVYNSMTNGIKYQYLQLQQFVVNY